MLKFIISSVFKRVVAALLTAAAVVVFILYAPLAWLMAVAYLLMALAVLEYALLLSRKVPLFSFRQVVSLLVGFAVIVGGLSALPAAAKIHGAKILLYLVAIVKFSDMGGFAVGLSTARLMKGGNHKLCPSVSPNKSWEGLGGSVLASVLMSMAFLPITHFSLPKAFLFGVVAALVGTAGDLVESKFKRWAGVKDSATFMPAGMGGILDMVDSLLFAPALLLLLV